MYSDRHIVCDVGGEVKGEWGVRKWGTGGRDKDKFKGNEKHNLHIPRLQLRDLLLAEVEGRVVWGEEVKAFRDVEGGKVEVEVAGGGAWECDVLVGGDGIWSSVRREVRMRERRSGSAANAPTARLRLHRIHLVSSRLSF